MADAIGIGILIGIASLAALIGLVRLVNWCDKTSEKIENNRFGIEWEKKMAGRKHLDLDVEIKKGVSEMSRLFLMHSEAALGGFVVLDKRITELEKAEKRGEKTNDS